MEKVFLVILIMIQGEPTIIEDGYAPLEMENMISCAFAAPNVINYLKDNKLDVNVECLTESELNELTKTLEKE